MFTSLGAGRREVGLSFWVGAEGQALMVRDSRYRVPPYMGHNGWITLDVTKTCDWDEVRDTRWEAAYTGKYLDDAKWLCRPGLPNNPCDAAASVTDFLADGTTRVSALPAESDPQPHSPGAQP